MLARASDTKQPTSPKYAENPVAVDDALKTRLKSQRKTAEFQELNSILEFVFNVHEVTKVDNRRTGDNPFNQPPTSTIHFNQPSTPIIQFNHKQSGRGGLLLQDNRQTVNHINQSDRGGLQLQNNR
ncbi:unnamed protein product [Penicillium viridicatum]